MLYVCVGFMNLNPIKTTLLNHFCSRSKCGNSSSKNKWS